MIVFLIALGIIPGICTVVVLGSGKWRAWALLASVSCLAIVHVCWMLGSDAGWGAALDLWLAGPDDFEARGVFLMLNAAATVLTLCTLGHWATTGVAARLRSGAPGESPAARERR